MRKFGKAAFLGFGALFLLATFFGAPRAHAVNPYVQNVFFGQDEAGDYISFDWTGIPPADVCSRFIIAAWFNRDNPHGISAAGETTPIDLAQGDLAGPNGAYSYFGASGLASGIVNHQCSISDINLSTNLPAHIKIYINPALFPYQLSFSASDFLTIQLFEYSLRVGNIDHLANLVSNDEEKYFYHVPENPLPIIPYENVKLSFVKAPFSDIPETDLLELSFDWVGPSRTIFLFAGMNGQVTGSAGFTPDPEKDISMNLENGENGNLYNVGLLSRDLNVQKGRHYAIPVKGMHFRTPSLELKLCNFFYPCQIQRFTAEQFMGRGFLSDDYVTLAFTSNAPYQYTLNDTNRYRFEDQTREPVIIVPGIMGTRLNRVSDGIEVWPRGDLMIAIGPDVYLDELKLASSGQQIANKKMNPAGIIERESIPGPDAVFYENLINSLIQDGYEVSSTLFAVPYDWRLDIRDELDRLDEKIQEAISNSPTGKIDIIAHSLGGLLIKQYLLQATNTEFLNKLILAGVPQLGAPGSFKLLNYGDDLDLKKFGLGLNEERAKEISQNMPAVYQLLPSRRYIQVNGGYVKDFRSGGVKILNYNEVNQFMTSSSTDSRNPAILNLADVFHQALDTQTVNVSRVYNIVGCRNSETIGEFRIYDKGHRDITILQGDGTVPLTSAMNLADGFTNYFVLYNKTKADHTGLINESEPITLIKNIINDQPDELPFGISTSTIDCFEAKEKPPANETTIMFSTHSPVELHVYDPQGRHTGPLPNGDIELGIPLSNYKRIEGNSFAFVPGGENYRTVIDAISDGTFDLKVRTFDGSSLLNTVTYLNIPLQSESSVTELNFMDIEGNLDLNLDIEGNGIVDESIEPTAILNAEESTDITPPEIIIRSPESRDYLHSEFLPLRIDITDPGSGVAFRTVKFDDRIMSSTETVDLFFERLGDHRVNIETSDRAGNPSNTEVKFRVIATLESTIADIEKAFSLGWITNKGIEESLIKKLNAIINLGDLLEETKDNLLEAFLRELDAQRDKHVNEQAYKLLSEDINWFLNN